VLVLLQQAQGGFLYHPLGVGAGVAGDFRELRFLLRSEMDFHG